MFHVERIVITQMAIRFFTATSVLMTGLSELHTQSAIYKNLLVCANVSKHNPDGF